MNCTRCSAPLPPGALQCNYCGTPTQLGVQQMHHQQQAALAHAAHATQTRRASVAKNAKLGLAFSLIGLFVCCAPMALVGSIFGIQSLRAAKQEKLPAPAGAIISIIAGGLSVLFFTFAMIWYWIDTRGQADRLAAVQKRLDGRREATALDAKLACDLVEERLLEDGFQDQKFGLASVRCDGALTTEPGTPSKARMSHIRASWSSKNIVLSACFLRGVRWFVIKLAEGESCGDIPSLQVSGAGNDKDLKKREAEAREQVASGESSEAARKYTDGLAKLRDQLRATKPSGDVTCPKAELAGFPSNSPKLATVDIDLLDASAAKAESRQWEWLTSANLRSLLRTKDEKEKARLAEELRKQSGDLIGVYRAELKFWPEIHKQDGLLKDDFSYSGGKFDGWLLVANLDRGQTICQVRFSFQNAERLSFKSRGITSEQSRAEAAVVDDFEDHFETAATAALKRISPDLKLGYKFLE